MKEISSRKDFNFFFRSDVSFEVLEFKENYMGFIIIGFVVCYLFGDFLMYVW